MDECLSEELVELAREQGHSESSHLTWLGKRGWQDWSLIALVVEQGWTFVTRNSIDFRGPPAAKGSKGQHSKVELHAGLICLNGPVGMDLDMQLELFAIALGELGSDADLINQCLEVTADDEGGITIVRYALPENGQ